MKEKLKIIYYFFYRLWKYKIAYIPREIKWFIQRGKHGYSDRDVWGLDTYMASVIYGSLKQLKENKCGCPATYNNKTKQYDYSVKRWNEILNEMVIGFALLNEMCSDSNSVESLWGCGNITAERRKQFEETTKKIHNNVNSDVKVLTFKDEQRIDKAFELFKEHFRCLWD